MIIRRIEIAVVAAAILLACTSMLSQPAARAAIQVGVEQRTRFALGSPGETRTVLHVKLDQTRTNDVLVNQVPSGFGVSENGEIGLVANLLVVIDRKGQPIENLAPKACRYGRKPGSRRTDPNGAVRTQLFCGRGKFDLPYVNGSPFDDKITLVDPRARVFLEMRDPLNEAEAMKFTGPSWIDGWDGDDVIGGGAGKDSITGGTGNDEIFADKGDDNIWGWLPPAYAGGSGALNVRDSDSISAWRGVDTVFGGYDRDFIFGGGEPDQLDGGEGSDVLVGGSGADLHLLGGDADPASDWIFADETAERNIFSGRPMNLHAERDSVECGRGWSNQVQYDQTDLLIGCPNGNFPETRPVQYPGDAPLWVQLGSWPSSPLTDPYATLYGPDAF